MDKPLSKLAEYLVSVFEKDEPFIQDKKISVNPFISKFASWYEKVRNAMDYREEEVILRAAIERILKRRVLLGGTGKTVAEPLVRELVWARYFPDESLSESILSEIETEIDLYLRLREVILNKAMLPEKKANEWMYHLLSSSMENTLHPNFKKEAMINFMFQIINQSIVIEDDTSQTRDAQVFIAIRKSFAKDDLAFLRYHLFKQFYGKISPENIDEVSKDFLRGYKEIEYQLSYPRKDRILNYIRRRTALFFILEDLLHMQKGKIRELYKSSTFSPRNTGPEGEISSARNLEKVLDKEEKNFKKIVYEICSYRYRGIASKVKRAIIRSVIFIILTKAFFALAIEGTFERLIYGQVLWSSILLNTGMSPVIMMLASAFIRTPGRDNSERIYNAINGVLTEEDPRLGAPLQIKKAADKNKSFMNTIFTLLWIVTFFLMFGVMSYILTRLNFNIVSQAVFIFFLAVVSFLTYRINQSSKIYTLGVKKTPTTPIVDFLFMPFVQVGRKLTEGVRQINILLFILDFAIETPFKGLFGFFEQWFLFLQVKREQME